MTDDTTDCGWCFEEMRPLQNTHPGDGEVVGDYCPNCGRIYLDELMDGTGTIRLDPKRKYADTDDQINND